jgi:signal transduction histidine kinase
LSDLINEALRVMNGPLQAKHVDIQPSLPTTADHLQADRDQIEQVLINVIGNAVDASPMDGSVIEITTNELIHQEQPGIMIRIRDGGKGIPPETLPRIFEPFFTSGKRHGTGLGMAICKNIIEGHHGEIYVTSEIGIGTTVSIWLPLSQDVQSVKG